MADHRMKRPAFQWYPGDHRRDVAVQACSFEARALWREILDLMHDGEPYGHLTAGGVPIAAEALARFVGKTVPLVRRWLKELEERKVFSRTAAGVIYSRRMTRDEHIREVRAAAGKKGGNPALVSPEHAAHLVKQKDKQPVKAPDKEDANQTGKQSPTPAVAVALAGAVEERVGTGGARDLDQERAAAAPLAFADLPPDAVRFVATLYPRGSVDPDRRRDVAAQLLATLGEGARLNGNATRVRAFSPARLEAKCREVIEHPPKKRDSAIVVLLKKLADTSDGSAPGHIAEVEAAAERQQDERTGAQRTAAAEAWLETRPDVAAELDTMLDTDEHMPRDPKDPIRKVMRRGHVLRAWTAAGEPEVSHA